MNLASQIRHFLTFLAGIGGMLLSWHLIGPDQVAVVNKAGADLIAPLTIILGAIVACLARLAIGWAVTLFQRGAGEIGNRSSGIPLWVVMCAAAALVGLPSCVTTNSPDGSKTTRPDAESISLAQGIATWAVSVWQTNEAQKAAEKAAERAAKAVPVRATK